MAESADDPELFWVDPPRRGIMPLDAFSRAAPAAARRAAAASSRSAATPPSTRSFAAAPRPPKNGPTPGSTTRSCVSTRRCSNAARRTASKCWLDDQLVGGFYGVSLGAAFFGESMFSRVTDASKVALVHLVARLRLGRFRLLDTQFLTPHLAQFGGVEISRARYHRLLADALPYRGVFPASAGGGAGCWRRGDSRGRAPCIRARLTS